MVRSGTDDERRRAKQAIAHAKAAEKEAKRLSKELPKGAGRRRLDQLLHEVGTVRKAAQAERKRAPRVAARRAERVATALESTAARLVPGGEDLRARRAGKKDAATEAKRRAKLMKRRRKQAQQVQKMAKGIAAHTIVQSITTPTDAEAKKADRKRVRRARREDARAAR